MSSQSGPPITSMISNGQLEKRQKNGIAFDDNSSMVDLFRKVGGTFDQSGAMFNMTVNVYNGQAQQPIPSGSFDDSNQDQDYERNSYGRRIVNEIEFGDLPTLTEEEEALIIDAEDAWVNWTDMKPHSIKIRIDAMRKKVPRSGVRMKADIDVIAELKILMKEARK